MSERVQQIAREAAADILLAEQSGSPTATAPTFETACREIIEAACLRAVQEATIALACFAVHRHPCPLVVDYKWAHINHAENCDCLEDDWLTDTGGAKATCGDLVCEVWAAIGRDGHPSCTCGLDAILGKAKG